jgi:hypothetical protein
VSLETENGQKRTFRGQQADQIVYQTRLKNFEDNATAEQIQRALKIANESIAAQIEAERTSTKRKDKSVREVKRNEVVDEAVPPTVTPVNGDIRLGVQPLGEIQFEDQRNDKKEGIPNPIDDRAGKGKVEVENPKIKPDNHQKYLTLMI